LIQLGLDEAQPLMFLGWVEVTVLYPFAQLPLLGDEVVDARERVAVGGFAFFCRSTSVPDTTGA